MNSQETSTQRIVLGFVLVPVLFNLMMWQNYPVNGHWLMPEILSGMGMTTALLIFGLGFGLFTSAFAMLCFFSFFSLNTVLKKLRINNYVRRHRGLYGALWIVTLTFGSFAGFLLVICAGEHTSISSIYFRGLQGFIIVGLGAGCIGMVVATVWSGLLDQAKKHLFRERKTITE